MANFMNLREDSNNIFGDMMGGQKRNEKGALKHFNNTPQVLAGNVVGHRTHDVWGQRKLS